MEFEEQPIKCNNGGSQPPTDKGGSKAMGDFLITMGIIATIILGMILITPIVENFGYICRFIKAVIEVIGERIFKAFKAIFKAIQHKRSVRK